MNNKKHTLVSFLSTFFIFLTLNNANAEQIKTMTGDDQVSVVISKNDLNRIKLINDRIKLLNYNNGDLITNQNKNLGDVYLRASNFSKKNINLFITSEKGFVYKLLLTLKDIPSEQIFIKNNKNYYVSKEGEKYSYNNDTPIEIKFEDSYKSGIIDLVKAMTFRDNVNGFYIVDREGDRIRFKKGLKIKWETSYMSNHRNNENNLSNLTGEIFSVKNITNEEVILKEEDFLKRGILAVKFDNLNLKPDEITNLYLIGGNK